MPFFTKKDGGPLVLEIPPAYEGSITGTIMNCWQEALEPEADGYSTVADELSALRCDSDHSVDPFCKESPRTRVHTTKNECVLRKSVAGRLGIELGSKPDSLDQTKPTRQSVPTLVGLAYAPLVQGARTAKCRPWRPHVVIEFSIE